MSAKHYRLAIAALASCVTLHAIAHELGGSRGPKLATAAPVPLSPPQACLRAIAAAELAYHTPPGLLLAIARTESGRFDPKTQQVQPWPWSMNINGAGVQVGSKTDAVAQATEATKQPNTSVDMGCMQVNNVQHPTAFQSVEDAFDPYSNAMYAAKFLTQLYAQTGDWLQATGYYHSHTPALASSYQTAVQTRLNGPSLIAAGFTFGGFVPAAPPPTPEMIMRTALKNAWGATLTDGAVPPPAPLPKPAPHETGRPRLLADGVFSHSTLR